MNSNLNTALSTAPDLSVYSNFLLNYFNKKFFSELINSLIFHADLSLVAPSSNNVEIFTFLKQFIYSLNGDLKDNNDLTIPKKHYFVLLSLTKKLIETREDVSYSFINYDNLLQHFNTNDSFVISILQHVVDNPILTSAQFQKLFDNIVQEIQIYNQMQIIKSAIYKWNSFLIESKNEDSSNISALNWVKNFKDTIIEANTGLSELTVLKQNENITDYLLFYDKESVKESLTSILNFLKTSYRTYKTGYALLDDNISGIESSSVMIISGPSNHAKSIFMLNICRSVMQLNESKEDTDVYVFITLEDDINKLFRRILSIFGNYDTSIIKSLFKKSSEILQNSDYKDILGQDITDRVSAVLEEITADSILSITQGKKRFVIKHSAENSFSMGDASRFIDTLQMQGLRVRAVFIDYIDILK